MSIFDFDSSNPVPLLPLLDTFRNGAKEHAAKMDSWLGFDLKNTEELISKTKHGSNLENFETWNHLSPQVFQTSYVELRALLNWILEQEIFKDYPIKIHDLGCAYFRLGFVINLCFNEKVFTAMGTEICNERVAESQRIALSRFKRPFNLDCANILDQNFSKLDEDLYFVYDFGTRSEIERFCSRFLKSFFDSQTKTKLLIARGERIKDVIRKNYFDLNYLLDNQNFAVISNRKNLDIK